MRKIINWFNSKIYCEFNIMDDEYENCQWISIFTKHVRIDLQCLLFGSNDIFWFDFSINIIR
jgi:hypothetical protein